jgi:hypothetical protein
VQALQDPQAEYVKLATVDTVAGKIRAAGDLLLAALRDPGSNMSERINATLNEFLTWPFRAGAASIVDSQGGKAMFNTVVYTGVETTALEATSIGSDAAAAVIHAVRDLGADEIRAGYEIIAGVKRLKRTHVPGPINTSPLGIILAVDSALSVKEIAELVVEENKNRPSTEWPDMVAVLTKGAVNYAMQMEGGPIMGLFTLPNFTSSRRPLPPMYIHVFMRGVGPLAFNAVCGLLFMHLMTFSPGTQLPTSQAVLDGNPNLGMTFGGYQFNLEGMLKPAPKEEYLAVLYRPLPFRIEDEKGNLLSHIQAIPWQGGAAIKMTGKLPLAGFLPFLGRVATDAQIFEQNDGAISSVLPIGKAEFRELLRRIQAQTNMTVKPEEPKMVVSKMSDEGTSTPVICRLSLSILQLRDVVFSDGAQREKFDEAYQVVFTTILNVRANAKKIAEMIEAHRTGIMSGRTGRIKGHTINIDENIDMPLHSAVAEFLNGSVRLLKDAMQRLLIVLELDVGCLYRKIGGFKTGIAKLKKTDPHLADYLERARAWSEPLINLRNDLHEGWLLPKFAYKESAGTIEIEEPRILGETTSAFVIRMSDRVFCFTEDVLVHALQARMPPELSIAEIPIADRKPECPERFEHTFIRGGATIWRVVYHDSKFEET